MSTGPAVITASQRLALSSALHLADARRGGVPGTSAGRVRRGLHLRIAVGFKLLELEAAEADGRLNDADRDNLAIARSRVDILESGNGPNR